MAAYLPNIPKDLLPIPPDEDDIMASLGIPVGIAAAPGTLDCSWLLEPDTPSPPAQQQLSQLILETDTRLPLLPISLNEDAGPSRPSREPAGLHKVVHDDGAIKKR
jgi:hypothetical protein